MSQFLQNILTLFVALWYYNFMTKYVAELIYILGKYYINKGEKSLKNNIGNST